MQLKFFPDKPFERSPDDLDSLDKTGNYICQQKVDGWRMVIILTAERAEFISRHNKVFTAEIEPEIRAEADTLLSVLPEKTQIDAEWISRRSCSMGEKYKLPPKLYVFDLIREGETWLNRTPYQQRYDSLKAAMAKLDLMTISLPVEGEAGKFSEFYEAQRQIRISEGVVLKHRQSLLIADRKESKQNPNWLKIKYRAMSDGGGTLDHLRKPKA